MRLIDNECGQAEFTISGNDMHWEITILISDNIEFFHLNWRGYNDANWWDNVSLRTNIIKGTGSKGTVKFFKLDYHTCKVTLSTEEEWEAQNAIN